MEHGPTDVPPTDDGEGMLDPKIGQNLDGLINRWGSDLRDEWTAAGRLGNDDYKQMFRTSLITICRVREARYAARRAHALNALYENVSAEMNGKSFNELLFIGQPSTNDFKKICGTD